MGKTNRRLRKPSSHTRLLSRIALWDVVWGGVSPLLAFLLRDGTLYNPELVAGYCGLSMLVSLFVFQWFQTGSPISRYYSMRDAVELLKACVLVAALSAVGLFLVSRLEDAPRSIPILSFFLLVSGLFAIRVMARLREFHSRAWAPGQAGKGQQVLIIGASRLAWFYSKMAEELAPGAFQIVAILDERPELKHRSLNGYPIIGTPAEFDRAVADYALHGVRIDQVVLATRQEDLSPVAWAEVARTCRERKIGLEVLPDRLTFAVPLQGDSRSASPVGIIRPSPQIVDAALLDRPFWKIKRALDFAITLTVVVLTSPIALIVCALVLIDVGIPIIFWQQRVGRSGAPLYLYKFRTLQAPFDPRTKQRREAQSPSAIGRFLRSRGGQRVDRQRAASRGRAAGRDLACGKPDVSRPGTNEAGFTLIEAMIAVVLMAFILAALGTVTEKWLSNWSRGFFHLQQDELTATGLDRIMADLSVAKYVSGAGDVPLFNGTERSVMFVRSTLNPNALTGLQIVRIAPISDERGPALVRSTSPFDPNMSGDEELEFSNPVVILRGPYLFSFSYAGSDRVWQDEWPAQAQLPRAVRLRIQDAATGATLSTTSTVIHTDLSAQCATGLSRLQQAASTLGQNNGAQANALRSCLGPSTSSAAAGADPLQQH